MTTRAPLPHAAAIAGFSLRDPAKDFIELIDLVEPIEKRRTLGALYPVQTRIVVSSFHYRRAKLCRQSLLKKRNVFIHQLLLQILGAG